MITSGPMNASAQIQAPAPTWIGGFTRGKAASRQSWEPAHKWAPCEIVARDPMVIGPKAYRIARSPTAHCARRSRFHGIVIRTVGKTCTSDSTLAPYIRSNIRRQPQNGLGDSRKIGVARPQRILPYSSLRVHFRALRFLMTSISVMHTASHNGPKNNKKSHSLQHGVDDVTAPRRHLCAKVGLR
jgi:hypothetical protein